MRILHTKINSEKRDDITQILTLGQQQMFEMALKPTNKPEKMYNNNNNNNNNNTAGNFSWDKFVISHHLPKLKEAKILIHSCKLNDTCPPPIRQIKIR